MSYFSKPVPSADTRNFDASRGLTKNTRVIIRNLLRHTVEVETISSVVAGRVVDPVRPYFSCFSPLILNCLRYAFTFRASTVIFNHTVLNSQSTENKYPLLFVMRRLSMDARVLLSKNWAWICEERFSPMVNCTPP
jgi:hypothetical protein